MLGFSINIFNRENAIEAHLSSDQTGHYPDIDRIFSLKIISFRC
jgi:hypothetical protein